ncbi:MAG: hypothetical protein EP343_13225 [Deltaproteobacteria bacterium]|nr:MAG: hypothetical protein EP343_13225 [Deltaproteobacteria bacterium]
MTKSSSEDMVSSSDISTSTPEVEAAVVEEQPVVEEVAQEATEADEDNLAKAANEEALEPEEPVELAASTEQPNTNGPLKLGSPEWEATFADLPSLSYDEAVARFKTGGVVRDLKLPFLNLVGTEVEQTLILEHCELDGCLALGAQFQGNLVLRNCLVRDRFVLGDKRKDDTPTPSRVLGEVRVEHCHFGERFNIYRSEVQGDVVVLRSQAQSFMGFDRCNLGGFVRVEGPGSCHGLSIYQAHIMGGLVVRKMRVLAHTESNKPLLNLGKARVEGGVELSQCEVEGRTELYRLQAGQESYQALYIKECELKDLFLKQAGFYGKCLIENTNFQGEVSANPPRTEHGKTRGRSATFHGEFTMGHCVLKGACNFQNAEVKGTANFSHCVLEKGGSFNQAAFEGSLSFWKTESHKELHFRKASFAGLANFGHTVWGARSSFNEAVFEEGASFFDARFHGDIFFSNAVFRDYLKMGRLQCEGGLILKGLQVGGELNLLNANIKDRWILSEGHLASVIAPGMNVGTWGSLANTQIHGEVFLDGMKVGGKAEPAKEDDKFVPGSFYLENVVLHQPFKMNNADIQGMLSLEGCSVHRELELIHTRVGHDLCLSKGYFRDVIRCERSTVKGTLRATLSRFREEVTLNQLQCQSATLAGSSFDQGFTLRSSEVIDSLSLNNVDVTGKADLSKCTFQRFFFDHLLVDYLMVEREQIGERLASEEAGNYTQAKNEYGILRQAFLVRNRYADMDWAYYRFCQANRREKKQSPLTFLEWVLFDLGFGYGTRPMNIALVALSLVLLFAGLFFAYPAGVADHTGKVISSLGFLDSIHLSVLTFASMEFSSHQPHALHSLKYAFALEGLLGIFLITLFVATISRKIIRT